jgi:hypothetical protein
MLFPFKDSCLILEFSRRFEAGVQQRQAMGALEDALQRQIFEPDIPFAFPGATPLPRVEPMP